MTFIQEPRSNELTVTEFYDALKVTNKEYSAMSWGGFNLFGDRKSIAELGRLMNKESFIKPLQDRLKETQDRLKEVQDQFDEVKKLYNTLFYKAYYDPK
jgi:hypothetical protein